MRRRVGSLTAAAALILATASATCDHAEPWVSSVPFDTARAWVVQGADSVPLLVEIAATDAQRTRGLMDRPSLEPNSGMVFLYDTVQPPDAGFWMWRTNMPLDIAFLDSTGVITTILAMVPCETRIHPTACRNYSPGTEYWSALEVSQGWFERQRLGNGARLSLEGETPWR